MNVESITYGLENTQCDSGYPSINKDVDALEKYLEIMREKILELQKRLDCVSVRVPVPSCGEVNNTPCVRRSSLSESIQKSIENVKELTEWIDDLKKELDLA